MTEYDPDYVPVKNYVLVAQKAVICCLNQLLILRRSDKAGGEGMWSLPGGGLERGEDAVRSIQREVVEETGLDIDLFRPFCSRAYQSEADQILLIGYFAQSETTQIRLNWEHNDFAWVKHDQLSEYELSDDARFVLDHYIAEKQLL
jgi:8-oxo-dGTP diphosphatase